MARILCDYGNAAELDVSGGSQDRCARLVGMGFDRWQTGGVRKALLITWPKPRRRWMPSSDGVIAESSLVRCVFDNDPDIIHNTRTKGKLILT